MLMQFYHSIDVFLKFFFSRKIEIKIESFDKSGSRLNFCRLVSNAMYKFFLQLVPSSASPLCSNFFFLNNFPHGMEGVMA